MSVTEQSGPASGEAAVSEYLRSDMASDCDEDVPADILDASSTATMAESPSVPATANDGASNATPARSPSKVKAAAAMWETTNTPKASHQARAVSPSASFRSIPASASTTSPLNRSPEKQPAQSTAPTSPSNSEPTFAHLKTPTSARAPTPATGTSESFADISLAPEPIDLSEVVLTPPPKEASATRSFFSSALGFGFPASSSAPQQPTPIVTDPVSLDTSRSPSTSSITPGWRSTVSNLFVPRGSTLPSPSNPTSDPNTAGPSRNPSTSFILNHIDSKSASRDRRISRENGGGEQLRAGFDRVRDEMESAAREMRRERDAAKADTEKPGEEAVDWAFWGRVVQDYEEVARSKPKDLSRAIQRGIPPVIRGSIWQLMSSSKSAELEDAYKALLKLPSMHEKAIVKDLNRTFPGHKFFQDDAGQETLFMVVKAYSLYDQEVGYCQGLAFIVAALLLNMPDEEAFCVLVRLMDSYNLRSHFLIDMPGLQLRLFQFDRLVEEILPLVHTHFLRQGVKSSMFASQWFMTLFSYRFPLSLVYRVLDIVFAEGIEAIFRFSLAILKQSEAKLVDLEFEQILNYLSSDLFEVYRIGGAKEATNGEAEEGEWRANDFVRDAYELRITPFMLDSYETEYEERCRNLNRHAHELDELRNANRNLSSQVKQLEMSVSMMNQEHVEIVRQLVMVKIEKEETENELVRYKMLYAELAHAQQDAMSTHSRFSVSSTSDTVSSAP